MSRATHVIAAALGFAVLTGCGADAPQTTDSSPARSGASVAGHITVFAAASLTETFTTLGDQFEQAHPGTKVTFSFAGSSALAGQIADGAAADVFASASTATMDQVVSAGDATNPITFATNWMQIAVPPGNPGGVAGIDDLADDSVKTAVCQPQVPCGATAEEVFDNAGITVDPVTLEPDVKAVLAKVKLDEVDAGIVYVTDVLSAGDDVQGVEIPAAVNASTDYPIATLTNGADQATAQAFVDYVLSPEGTAVLEAAGFEAPPGR